MSQQQTASHDEYYYETPYPINYDEEYHLTEGADQMSGGEGNDTLYGYGGDDWLEGDGWYDTGNGYLPYVGDDVLWGGSGNDFLDGGMGNDTLMGEEGDDVLNAGWGSDFIDGGPGIDTVVYGFYTNDTDDTGLTINLSTNGNSYDQVVNVENVIGTDYNDLIIGDAGANLLEGTYGNDTLDGGYGNDTIDGGAGDDLLIGGWGADLHIGGEGNDTVSFEYYTGTGNIFIDLSNNGNGYEGFISVENAIGSDANDWIRGTAENNILDGLDGDDTLVGGDGHDTLSGGAGADTFVFDLATEPETETITDFTVGEDRLDFSGTGLQFEDFSIWGYSTGTDTDGDGELEWTHGGVMISYIVNYHEFGGYDGAVIYLEGVADGSITADDFIF